MISAGIVGGAGYTAGELLRLLLPHPEVSISGIHSTSHAGQLVTAVHDDLIGDTDLEFSSDIPANAEVLYLCMGHGRSKEFLETTNVDMATRIIDLSQDFRMDSHPKRMFVYGLPEAYRSDILESKNTANPGCFATAIQLGLLPLADTQLLKSEIQVTGITGSTGAGQKPRETTHFSWRNNNLSVYKPFTHQHLQEIRQTLGSLQSVFDHAINFVPVRGDFPRGIFAVMHLKSDLKEPDARSLYERYYADAPFTHFTPENPSLKQVVNTNKCLLYMEKHEDNLMIVSMIDNLLKGASGQAVQNMNLMFGLNEKTGLQLKASVF